MTKDDEGFGAEMAKIGVKPLSKRQQKVLSAKKAFDVNIPLRRQAAASELPIENYPDHYAGIEWLGPHDIVEFKRPGLQQEAFKDLKRGRHDVGAVLDLHQYRVEEAKIALFQFIRDCVEQNVRYAIVIHGKGWHVSREGNDQGENYGDKPVSRIKSHVVHWLKTLDKVIAFSSAQARDGGTGALYVLLKNNNVNNRGNL